MEFKKYYRKTLHHFYRRLTMRVYFRKYLSRRIGFVLFTFLVLLLYFYYVLVISRNRALMKLQEELFSGAVLEPSSCKIPHLPVDNPDIMKHIYNVDKITCKTQEDWVAVNGTHAFVTDQAKAKWDGNIECKFTEIERIDDDNVKLEKFTKGQSHKFESSDFIEASCTSNKQGWSSFFASPRSSVQLPGNVITKKESGVHPPLNVLMWGHDSLSKNMFIRKLPSTLEYLTNVLDGHILEGYNIVGDGTPQALIPILTGKTESELPETRKRMIATATYVDIYPFVWKEFSRKGYLTGFIEDCSEIGTFTYRLKGFKEQPTDFYMRPFFRASEPQFYKFPKYCLGSVPTHQKIIDYTKSIMNFKKEIPKFIFAFSSELSHGSINEIQGADLDIRKFFSDMHQAGILNNTILIVFCDHGHRFTAVRESQQGKQEERKPFFMFVFPSWFRKTYSLAHSNFLTNTKRLSTPFDIHPTLQDILRLSSGDLTEHEISTHNLVLSRQMSLFREIPENRTCADAHIEPHWCACLEWKEMKPSSPVSIRAAQAFVNFLNKLTASNREMCAELSLQKILWAANIHPQEDLLKFKQSADTDGREADLSHYTFVKRAIIQLKLETVPGNGVFEVSLAFNVADEQFIIQESDISRINKYASQAVCVEADPTLEHLRKYCFCQKN